MLPDPSPDWRPGATHWPRHAIVRPPVPTWVRRLGAVSGLVIAVLVSAAAFVFDALSHGNPFGPSVAPPTLAAGMIGGWLAAPGAWYARTRRDWIVVVIGLGVLAIAIGDATEVANLVICQAQSGFAGIAGWPSPLDVATGFSGLLAGSVGLFLLGLVFVGWFAAPFTIGAATVWAVVMRLARPRLGRTGP
jgi:hypothetical protein